MRFLGRLARNTIITSLVFPAGGYYYQSPTKGNLQYFGLAGFALNVLRLDAFIANFTLATGPEPLTSRPDSPFHAHFRHGRCKGNFRTKIKLESWMYVPEWVMSVHRLTDNRDLILCGVKIPYEKGLLGHSDADVALRAG